MVKINRLGQYKDPRLYIEPASRLIKTLITQQYSVRIVTK